MMNNNLWSTFRLMEPVDNLMTQSEVVETCDEYNFLPLPASFISLPAYCATFELYLRDAFSRS
jgi:hypothetical protein